MSNLYELTAYHAQLLAMLEDEELDQQTVLDTLEGIEGEIEAKATGYVYVTRQMEADLQAVTTEYERFKAKKEHLENNIKRLKDALKQALILTAHDDKEGLKAGPFTLKVAKNGGKQPLVITGEVPESMTKVIVEPDKDRIKDSLNGLDENDSCSWAHLEERGTHLTIR